MNELNADLLARKKAIKATAISRSFIIRRELEEERVKTYFSEQQQRNVEKKRLLINCTELLGDINDSTENKIPRFKRDPAVGTTTLENPSDNKTFCHLDGHNSKIQEGFDVPLELNSGISKIQPERESSLTLNSEMDENDIFYRDLLLRYCSDFFMDNRSQNEYLPSSSKTKRSNSSTTVNKVDIVSEIEHTGLSSKLGNKVLSSKMEHATVLITALELKSIERANEMLLFEWKQVEINVTKSEGNSQHCTINPESSNIDHHIFAQKEKSVIANLQPIVRDAKFLFEIYLQTIEYMAPFFTMLRQNNIQKLVLDHLLEIIQHLQQREYVKANDAYLRLSIGNAPWPIGVTMVCIHERSARERIHSNQVAHVLNDERQRKWIQSIKRLMSFCQRTYPPTDITKALG